MTNAMQAADWVRIQGQLSLVITAAFHIVNGELQHHDGQDCEEGKQQDIEPVQEASQLIFETRKPKAWEKCNCGVIPPFAPEPVDLPALRIMSLMEAVHDERDDGKR